MSELALLLLSIFGLTIILVDGVRRYALKYLLDHPNARSSHITPMPRGGGLGCVLVFVFAVIYLFWNERVRLEIPLITALGIFVAAIGFWDDHRSIAASWRILLHSLAALLAVLALIILPEPPLNSDFESLKMLGILVGIVFITWCLNLFNFMDGIDGLAASEACFVAFGLAIFSYSSSHSLALVELILGQVSMGFLIWNWPPAKIFMGDVGSGFFGFMLGVLILLSGIQAPIMIAVGLILFAVFIADSTYTLIYRILTGQRWYDAHCSHAYQILAKRSGHLRVVKTCMLINLTYLLPLATATIYFPELVWCWLLLAYCPLVCAVSRIGAGNPAKAA